MLWLQYLSDSDSDKVKYIVTSKKERDVYWLYSVGKDGSLKKLHQAQTPDSLEKYVKW